MSIEKDLIAAEQAVANFVKKEVDGAEALISKGEAIYTKIEPDLVAFKNDAVIAYNAAKLIVPQSVPLLNTLATIIADLTSAGI